MVKLLANGSISMKLRNIISNIEFNVNRDDLVMKLKNELSEVITAPILPKSIALETNLKDMNVIHLQSPSLKLIIKNKKRQGLENRALATFSETLKGYKKGNLLLVDISMKLIERFLLSNEMFDMDNKDKEYLQFLHSHIKKLGKGNIWIYSTSDNKCFYFLNKENVD